MKYRFFYTKPVIIILCCVAMSILCICVVLVVLTHKNNSKTTDDVLRITADTNVCVVTKYSCGHMAQYTTSEYTGYTEDMLRQIANCKITCFSIDKVTMEFSTEKCCENHFLLMLAAENTLAIFSTDKKPLADAQIMEIVFETSVISENEYMRLKQGIIFDSLEEINSYIESMET
ncbi:MAG: hypothetical protein IJO93_01405 [Clostridia bacterium]|nr:hypothetical protein [Clostridia bacterium]